MKRPEAPPESFVGIQGDSLHITNMRKKIKEQMNKTEKKSSSILINGKQFPERNFNSQMAKRRSNTCSAPIKSRYVDIDSSPNSQSVDCYFMYYEFPAFPSNSLFKHKTMMPKSYFPKTVQERIPTRAEFKKLFTTKKISQIDSMLADTLPNTPHESNMQSPRSSQKPRRRSLSQSKMRMSYPQNKRSFLTVI